MTLGVLTGPTSNLKIIILSRSGIKIGMVDGLKNWLTRIIFGYFELVSSCPKLACSAILFSPAHEITGFPPEILLFPRIFFQKMAHSSLRYDVSKAGRLLNKSPSSSANCSIEAASTLFLHGSTARRLFSSAGQLSTDHELPKKNISRSGALSSGVTYITQLIMGTSRTCGSGDSLQIYAKYIHFV